MSHSLSGFDKSIEQNKVPYDPEEAARSLKDKLSNKPKSAQIKEEARRLLDNSIIYYQGRPLGTPAACDTSKEALNYKHIFPRDFFPVAIYYLSQREFEIVQHFLQVSSGLVKHGVMAACFQPQPSNGHLKADHGDCAIGRVTPYDSGLLWIILLRAYLKATNDVTLVRQENIQKCVREILLHSMCRSDRSSALLYAPDGSCMIDRRMGIDGFFIEIQVLFHAALSAAQEVLDVNDDNQDIIPAVKQHLERLTSHVRRHYCLNDSRLAEIYHSNVEEFGEQGIISLIEQRWDDLVGEMPVRIAFPAPQGQQEWERVTGCDPKNRPNSYHAGGSWPALLWLLVAAAEKTGNPNLGQRAIEIAESRLSEDNYPEYYDWGGRFVGRQARRYQTWSIAGYLLAKELMENSQHLDLISFDN